MSKEIKEYGKEFTGAFKNVKYKDYKFKKNNKKPVFLESISQFKNLLNLKDGMTFSFHHHLRNGDYVLNMIMEYIHSLKIKDITIASSSFFPCHETIIKMMEDGTVKTLHGDYFSGPVAEAVSKGKCKQPVVITTHGGRPREIMENELPIDIAFIATPSVDKDGNGTGSQGPSNCGVLGYAIADSIMAKKVVLITDNIVSEINQKEIEFYNVDYVLKVDKIGDPKGIVSGTTQITKDPVGIKIAQKCAKVIENSGYYKEGFNFQTGAGGVSLAVAKELKEIMKRTGVKGGFASGGITDYLVEMLEEGYFKKLYDVQCFTVGATESIVKNKNHIKMTANEYANINNKNNIANKLDFVILGASEVDLNFNVNVTTGSDGVIIGGSGGHADTAAGAKVSIIVSKLVNSRRSVIVDRVRTISTPGETIDIIVTDRGIAINPKRTDLIENLSKIKSLDIVNIEELYRRAINLTGKPKKRKISDEVVAISKYRDGTILDLIYKV
ncbi:citrate lyase subunit alpha [Miniphocaeibacter halophilus]|uniref:citrate lyase subunit alpha n=1 Tax=Miniphocaeibacter halophilus TaxID=2931922 RepID=UPI001FB30308|nr:citrate lyase subunit alpha [Miniphocaeibacter halophilus]